MNPQDSVILLMSNDKLTFKQLHDRLDILEEHVKRLQIENKQLRKENTELKEIIKRIEARLRVVDGPHTPSSQVPIYTKNNTGNTTNDNNPKKAEDQKKRQNKRGREKGHKGTTLTLKSTKIVNDYISECHHCRCLIPKSIQKQYYSYQEVESPVEIKLDVIQHNMFTSVCPNCSSKEETDKKNKGTLFGNNMRAFVSLLYEVGRTPLSGICEIIEAFLKQKFSKSMIYKALYANAVVLDKRVIDIKKEVLASGSIHVDETSYPVILHGRMLGWIWVYASKTQVYFDFADTRSKIEFERNIDPGGGAVINVDGYNAYASYPLKQRCWAHILRESKALSKKSLIGWNIHNSLNSLFVSLQETLPTNKPKGIRKHAIVKIDEILALRDLLGLRDLSNEDAQIIVFLDKLGRAKNELLTALNYDDVDLTNNLAERLLRGIVLQRKIRRFVASENGKKILINHATVFQTWKFKKLNPYEELIKLLENNNASVA